MYTPQQQPISHKQAAFTIVELLIVIVVIAILAAISMLAYSGLQNRAAEPPSSQTSPKPASN